jgi:DNA-binding XRE family transcriptional regulator
MSLQFTPAQLRAARALLNWSRSELASNAGVSEQTIHRLENGLNEPEVKTQIVLRRSLERAGIEFQGLDGVRSKSEDVQLLNGTEGLSQFFDDVYEHVRKFGGLIRQIGINEDIFTKHMGDCSQIHIDRMSALAKENPRLPKQRAIVQENDYNFDCAAYTTYRWYPKKQFSCVPFYVYGGTLGIMNFQNDQSIKIINIRSTPIAEAYNIQFDDIWERSRIPTKKVLHR